MVKKELKAFNKITTGFVIQNYKKRGNKFVCVGQNFVAGDQVDMENEEGNPLAGLPNYEYQPFEMKQPKIEDNEDEDSDITCYKVICPCETELEINEGETVVCPNCGRELDDKGTVL